MTRPAGTTPFPHADSEYFAAMAAKNESPQRLIIGPWSHVGMRGDATLDARRRLRRRTSVWGVQRYFDEQLAFFDRWLPDDASGAPADEAPVRIFVMGGGSGRKTELGKLDHGGRWRDEHEWPLARATEQTPPPARATARSRAEAPAADAEPRRFTYDPDDPVPTIGGTTARSASCRPAGAGHRAGVGAPAQPGAPAAQHHDPRSAPTRRSRAEYFTAREPYRRLSERADVLVYETEPLAEPVEVTGRAR